MPLVKDRAWVLEMHQHAAGASKGEPAEIYYEDYNSELVVVYAEDQPDTIRYLTISDVRELGLTPDELRSLALTNLMRLVPEPAIEGRDGRYIVSADGTYDVSFLLVDSIWTSERMLVNGEYVAAIPNRDVLFVAGSGNKDYVDALRQFAQQMHQNNPHRLTPRLFVRRAGRFVPLD